MTPRLPSFVAAFTFFDTSSGCRKLVLALFPILLITAAPTSGESITGTAKVAPTTFGDATITGPGLNLFINSTGGPGGEFLACESNIGCAATLHVGTSGEVVPVISGGSYNGIAANTLDGILTFSANSFTFGNVPSGPYSYTENVLVSGSLTGLDDNGTPLFKFKIDANGKMNFSGTASQSGSISIVKFTNADYTFAGTAAAGPAVPEPASLQLITLGCSLFFGNIVSVRRRL
jgi:hypothetical protein